MDALRATYPEAHCELVYQDPLQLLIATILSAQCTDKMVNRVTPALFKKYTDALSYADAPEGELEKDIASIGFFRSKARNIRNCCRKLVENHAGKVPADMEALIALDGVGRKTANVVLGNAFGINEGIVVDTHVGRLAGRLNLSPNEDPKKVELDLMKLVPKDQWAMLSHWLIWHGRRRCQARKPDCAICELRMLCPSADRMAPARKPGHSKPEAGA